MPQTSAPEPVTVNVPLLCVALPSEPTAPTSLLTHGAVKPPTVFVDGSFVVVVPPSLLVLLPPVLLVEVVPPSLLVVVMPPSLLVVPPVLFVSVPMVLLRTPLTVMLSRTALFNALVVVCAVVHKPT